MVSIHAFQAWDPGSIPGQRIFYFMPVNIPSESRVAAELGQSLEISNVAEGEIERLRSYLLLLDEQIAREAQEHAELEESLRSQITNLEEKASFWLEQAHQTQDENRKTLEEENKILKDRLVLQAEETEEARAMALALAAQITEQKQAIENLHSALDLLQAGTHIWFF